MSLRDATREIIALVEKKSGTSVRVVQDRTLTTAAAVRMASESLPVHLIAWNPASQSAPDYMIAYECGFILRLYDIPLDRRKRYGITEAGRQQVGVMLRDIAAQLGLEQDAAAILRDRLFQGLMVQLLSIPVGLRVDAWIRNQYACLSGLQEESVIQQLEVNCDSLKPEVRKISPESIYRPSIAMNASFAEFWARELGEPRHVLPYKGSKYWATGQKLTAISEQIPDDPREDTRLVDEWAAELGLTGWYQWDSHT
jgi:hypothetical protein